MLCGSFFSLRLSPRYTCRAFSVLFLESGIDTPDQGPGAGVGEARHPRQRNMPRVLPDRDERGVTRHADGESSCEMTHAEGSTRSSAHTSGGVSPTGAPMSTDTSGLSTRGKVHHTTSPAAVARFPQLGISPEPLSPLGRPFPMNRRVIQTQCPCG